MKRVEQEDGLCFPACVEMALSHFGRNLDHRIIANNVGADPERGTPSRKRVRKFLERSGFGVYEKEGTDWDDFRALSKLALPMLAIFNDDRTLPADGHVVVVEKVHKKRLDVIDPQDAKSHQFERDWFEERWHSEDMDGKCYRYIMMINR